MSISRTIEPRSLAGMIQRAGRIVALAGVVLPLLLIGGLKFTQFEIEALKPMIGSTPWLSWMYAVLGEARTSYLLGVVEITTALLFIASPRFLAQASSEVRLLRSRFLPRRRCSSPFRSGSRLRAASRRSTGPARS